MSLSTLLLVILILILVGVIPTWPHSRAWGYAPSGGIRDSVIFRRWHLLKCTGRNDKQLESHGVHY
jgi:hypothetical protein